MGLLGKQSDEARPALNGSRWRVLIVDDHPLYRDALGELLQNKLGLVVVGEAETEDDAFQQVAIAKPDLVTVDVSLASGNGLSLIAKIKQRTTTPHVLVISMYVDRVYADLAIAAGASGYVCKHIDGPELKLAFDTIRNGKVYIAPNIVQGMLRTRPALSESSQALTEKQLSGRELQIFSLIGQGRNTHQIATELRLAVSTVETYRERLKTKLNLATGAELARHAFFWAIQTDTAMPSVPLENSPPVTLFD